MHTLVLLLGGNRGNTKKIFRQASTLLSEQIGSISSTSSVYRSKSWGFDDEHDFLNQIIIIHTQKTAQDCLHICLSIENDLGRIRPAHTTGYTSRNIDIDILFFDSTIIEEENLQIPHPRIQDRRFTLEPLCEIIPHFIHPRLQQSCLALLKQCTDSLRVEKL
ncbi:MAG: 2-amino-4-hydroxy-6-hydroxymethyldihydropteridine diphosphokinase [Bacteroidales bacterium]|jgi:2-amino-4-hydroxy-6-hydroxymethyldihydropteridine diphosphokinase|nr:2-amino-4-hydroxy-6-hydroxymethyldihydropteridine diphosphokinase [Bacteroidales bacterium]